MVKHFSTFGIIMVIIFGYCTSGQRPGAESSNQQTTPDSLALAADLVKRGEYLVGILGCSDCHSPKRIGAQGPEIIPELLLSGYQGNQPVPPFDSKLTAQGFALFVPDLTAAKGPWGVSFAANLTPDETGIGSWSEEQFIKAFTQGISKGLDNNRPLLPPMPWQNYQNMHAEDLKAVFAYLKSIPAVKNNVPAPIPPDQM